MVCTGGTRGDVQPALALAKALQDAGHDVLLIGPPENKSWVESYGCPFAGLSVNVEEAVKNLSASMSIVDLLKFVRLLKKGIATQLDDFPPLLAGSDLAIGISLVFGLKSVTEYLGIPYLFLGTSPQVFPSGEYPTIALKNHYLPRWVNRMDWRIVRKMNALVWLGLVNRRRRSWGLPVVRGSVWNYILEPMVLAISDEEMGPVPEDVKMAYHQVGHLPLKQHGSLTEEVESFLSAGSPPVFIGFGSMPVGGEKIERLVLEAARQSGRRLLVGGGWADSDGFKAGHDHLAVGSLPHEQLFPRMAAVVHHGGAGTTATAARAGVPQIIVPHYFDQFYWAKRIHQTGLGPRAVSQKKLTAKNLAEAIQKATSDPAYIERAQEMADTLKKKDSLGEAIRYIEAHYSPREGQPA